MLKRHEELERFSLLILSHVLRFAARMVHGWKSAGAIHVSRALAARVLDDLAYVLVWGEHDGRSVRVLIFWRARGREYHLNANFLNDPSRVMRGGYFCSKGL